MFSPFIIDQSGMLTAYTANESDVTVPNGVRVIGPGVFAHHQELVRVVLPDSVTKIEANAFLECERLVEVRMPGHLRFVGRSAFRNCTSLHHMALPDSIQIIEGGAFFDCYALETLSLPGTLRRSKYGVFWDCRSLHTIIVRGRSTPATADMLTQLWGLLHDCAPLHALHIDNLAHVPTEWLPQAVIGYAERGGDLRAPTGRACIAYLRKHLTKMAPQVVACPVLLNLLCDRAMLPPDLVDLFLDAAQQQAQVESTARLIDYRASDHVRHALMQKQLRLEQQADAIAERSMARLRMKGIAGLTFTAVGRLSAQAYFRNRDELSRFLRTRGAQYVPTIGEQVDHIVADTVLPPDKQTLADALGLPVITSEELLRMADDIR